MSRPGQIERINEALEGRYAIEGELGEGGMATVYLARDLRHNRHVALKVLKPELAAVVGAERFLAEIETTASLQHPHILPLFDSGEAGSFLFYVMPYVEGDSLQDRLARERQLPVEEAVRIAAEVAEALQLAHEHGVIHRDIKPANILLSRGRPLLMDFGIAFAVSEAGGGRLTETGLSVGTPYYMSPEQASADREPSAASDVYSVGCVLYEMLVGEPPFTGNSAQAVLAKILTTDAPVATEARASIPPNVDAAIRKALQKLPADRFSSTQALADALRDPSFRYGADETGGTGDAGRWRRLALSGWGAAALLALVTSFALLRPDPQLPVTRFSTPFLEEQAPVWFLELTDDGSAVVYSGPGAVGGESQLLVRRWDELSATPIPGTGGAITLALSPDGQYVAATFGFPGPLRFLPLEGGPLQTLVPSAWAVNAWAPNGDIYFQRVDGGGISRIPSTGGPEEVVTQIEDREVMHGDLIVLPGARMGVFQVWYDLSGNGSELWSLDLATGERAMLTRGRTPSYAETGHLLYGTSEGLLMAVPIDARTARLEGPAFPVAEDLAMDSYFGAMHYSVSASGSIVYQSGTLGGGSEQLVWVERDGSVQPVEAGWTFNRSSNNIGWSLSPEGDRIALGLRNEGNNDIWIKNLADSTFQRLTSYEGGDVSPTWTPDGRYVTYFRDAGVALSVDGYARRDFDAWRRRADFVGQPELILDYERSIVQGQWSPDGTWLLVRTAEQVEEDRERDILGYQPSRGGEPQLLVESTAFHEHRPTLSPDGRWLAYSSDETGRDEIYARPFPNVDSTRVTISAGGGVGPLWAHNGRELFFVDADRDLVVAELDTASGLSVVRRTPLFTIPEDVRVELDADFYDITRDDRRFLMARAVEGVGGGSSFVYVQNWLAHVRAQIPD